MSSHRQEKVEGRLQAIIASFLNKTAGLKSVITVTRCEASSDLKKVIAYITVFPEDYEAEALAFAKRQRQTIRELIAEEMPMKTIPFVEMEIDEGEKNRQKIDKIISSLNS